MFNSWKKFRKKETLVLLIDGCLDTQVKTLDSQIQTLDIKVQTLSNLCPTFLQCLSKLCPTLPKVQHLSRLWIIKSRLCPITSAKVQGLSRLWTPKYRLWTLKSSWLGTPKFGLWTSKSKSSIWMQTLDKLRTDFEQILDRFWRWWNPMEYFVEAHESLSQRVTRKSQDKLG